MGLQWNSIKPIWADLSIVYGIVGAFESCFYSRGRTLKQKFKQKINCSLQTVVYFFTIV